MDCDLLNQRILETTQLIHSRHPELSTFIEEMPITIPTQDGNITSHILEDYLSTLLSVVKNYEVTHFS
jgi:hypothetical protein